MTGIIIAIFALLFNSIVGGSVAVPKKAITHQPIPPALSVECAEAVLTAEVPETADKPKRHQFASEEAYKVGLAKFANGGSSSVTLEDGSECNL